MNRISGKWGRGLGKQGRREESNPSRGKGMSPSLKEECEVITDQAEGRQPPSPVTWPGHVLTVPVAHSLTRVSRESY